MMLGDSRFIQLFAASMLSLWFWGGAQVDAQRLEPPQPAVHSEFPTPSTWSQPFDPIDDASFFDPSDLTPATTSAPHARPPAAPPVAQSLPSSGPASQVSLDETPAAPWSIDQLISPERFRGSASTFAFLSAVSLAPALLLMTTSFVRLSIVFSLLRQAVGAQVLPSNQILTTLAMFLTVCIMWPTWTQVYDEAIVPYTEGTQQMSAEEAWAKGVAPIRRFMSDQIELADNSENIVMFYETLPSLESATPESYADVPLRVLLPAYLLSELKVAFLLGFQVYLPFLVIDIFVSAVTASMGMLMLPPLSISLPLKLIVFVLVDGWNLLAGTLMTSFVIPGG